MSNLVLCSSGAFTHEVRLSDHSGIIHTAPLVEADGIEVIFYASWYGRSDAIARDIARHRISCPVVHGEKGIARLWGSEDSETRRTGIERFEENVEFAARVGAEKMVLHLWERPEGDATLERNLEYYDRALDRAEELGVRLAAETIPTIVGSPLQHILSIARRFPRSEITFDTEFLAHHGEVEEAFSTSTLKALPQLSHLHVKDYRGALVSPAGVRTYLHPGEGELDFKALFGNLLSSSYSGAVTLEATGFVDGVFSLEKVNASLNYLRSLISSLGDFSICQDSL